jgi:hypothetical protein
VATAEVTNATSATTSRCFPVCCSMAH